MIKSLRVLSACAVLSLCIAPLLADTPKPQRINRAIELLAQGQPIYYTGSHEGTEGNFEQGVKDAQTYADYISYDMEHAPFDVKGLADYMKGLAKGGPTKSGHRTPTVIVNVPVNGTDEASVRANAWMFQQVLATGVHGVLLCHADTPGAVRAFIEAVRFPAYGGRRGVHGNSTAARIWGITADEYGEKALAIASDKDYKDILKNCYYLLGEVNLLMDNEERSDLYFDKLQEFYPHLPVLKQFLRTFDVSNIINLKNPF